jgi:tetratricopeptide (TPR) repeat protein
VLERLIGGSEAERFTSRASGLRGYKARHILATYYKEAGRLDDAVAQWRLALAEQPGFLPPIFALGDVAVTRQDWAGLEEIVARLRALPNVAAEAEVYRARAHHARREFTAALAILDGLLTPNPHLLSACIVRSKVLIDEGRDWVGAEQALRVVLAIAPARNNATMTTCHIAEQALRVVLAIAPHPAETRQSLDMLLRRHAG